MFPEIVNEPDEWVLKRIDVLYNYFMDTKIIRTWGGAELNIWATCNHF